MTGSTLYVTKRTLVDALQFDGTAESALACIAAFHLKRATYQPGHTPKTGSLESERLIFRATEWLVKQPGHPVAAFENREFRARFELPSDPRREAERIIHRAITAAKRDGYLTDGPNGPAILAHRLEALLVATL